MIQGLISNWRGQQETRSGRPRLAEMRGFFVRLRRRKAVLLKTSMNRHVSAPPVAAGADDVHEVRRGRRSPGGVAPSAKRFRLETLDEHEQG